MVPSQPLAKGTDKAPLQTLAFGFCASNSLEGFFFFCLEDMVSIFSKNNLKYIHDI